MCIFIYYFQVLFFAGGWVFFLKQLFKDYEVSILWSITFFICLLSSLKPSWSHQYTKLSYDSSTSVLPHVFSFRSWRSQRSTKIIDLLSDNTPTDLNYHLYRFKADCWLYFDDCWTGMIHPSYFDHHKWKNRVWF